MFSDLLRALHFAAERHSRQRRKGPGAEPYINHLVEVGFLLSDVGQVDDAVKLIKLADLCSNIASVPGDWAPDRIKDYFAWSRQAAALCAGVSAPLDSLCLSRCATGTIGRA